MPTEVGFQEAIWQLLSQSEANQSLLGRWPQLQLTLSGLAEHSLPICDSHLARAQVSL